MKITQNCKKEHERIVCNINKYLSVLVFGKVVVLTDEIITTNEYRKIFPAACALKLLEPTLPILVHNSAGNFIDVDKNNLKKKTLGSRRQ